MTERMPNPKLIAFCEELLEGAKSGENVSLFFVVEKDNGALDYAGAGHINAGSIGCAELLKANMVRDFN